MTKLIEVALPLEAISAASRRDKDKKVGTIKNVHKWFAPMPTPAWRALLFAALVDDPGEGPARDSLLSLVEDLVPAHGGAPSGEALASAKAVLHQHIGDDPPTIFDPFCGGGSTLVEAQRLGLPAAGSDLNPIPTLITRTITNLVPQMMGRPALVGDATRLRGVAGHPLEGFLADCRHYADRVRARAWNDVGNLYPAAPGGGTVVAWFWARTVICPNPACRAIAPLASSFWLSKRRNALTWIEAVPQGPGQAVRFNVSVASSGGPSRNGTMVSRTSAICATCESAIPLDHVRAEGQEHRLGQQLMAVAVDRDGERVYLPPDGAMPPAVDRPDDAPDIELLGKATVNLGGYGFQTFGDLFTNRQLVMLDCFAQAVANCADEVRSDGGDDAQATAVATVLGIGLSKLAMNHSTQTRPEPASGTSNGGIHPAFSRHALPMV